MSTRTRQRIGYSTLVVLFVALVVAVIASNVWLRGARLDLTENGLYTLGNGTKAVLKDIKEPIDLYFFFSNDSTKNLQQIRAYANRVREMLEEFAASTPDGKLVLHVVDPVPFSEDEDRAEQFGLQAANIGAAGDNVYFGLAGSNSIGKTDTIAFFDPRKEMFLEYDLARLVYNLSNTKKTVVGLLTSAPIGGGFDPVTQQPSQPWVVVEQARKLFDIRTLPASVLKIDDDVNVLWIVHPTMLDESTQYAIDQFVMRGGRALIFVDPLAEILASQGPPGGPGAEQATSTLDKLFTAWGVKFNTREVVADNHYALSIGGRQRPVRHVGLLGLNAEAMSTDEVITQGLNSVNVGVAGHLESAEGAMSKLTPLLHSSAEAELMPADRFQFLADPGELLNNYTPGGKEQVIAARLSGPLKSAFPDGAPKVEGRDAPVDAALSTTHLASTDSANLVIVADVDMLSDRLWAQAQSFLGQRVVSAFANNGDFVFNTLDNLSGSAALIGLRSRATYTRPFTKVEELRSQADVQFRATEQRLQAELRDTEQKLGELQAARKDQSSLMMSPEQQAEVQKFLDAQVRIRQELRNVRRNLDRDIDNLGTTLKILNIALVPILLTALALGAVVVKRRRKARA
jgi:ABC-type uncharacterized transport system involved in gliding motility auxiliary subunit